MKLDQPAEHDLYRASTAVLRAHESKDFLGGVIASLSIPWGFNKGDEDLGGYHLIWPRDLVETAFGFLAAGALARCRACTALSGIHARSRWALGAEYVDRWPPLLERPPDGRSGVSHPAGRSPCARSAHRAWRPETLVADGEKRGGFVARMGR